MCLDKYREKFFKTDSYLSSLFDEIDDYLNKAVNSLNELKRVDGKKERAVGQHSSSLDELTTATMASESSTSSVSEPTSGLVQANEHLYSLTKSNKKFLQENLNNLNRTVTLVRKSMIELIITSTMLGGLKQVDKINFSFLYYNKNSV